MIPINLTFLGTSNAMPTIQRNHPAILLEYSGETILFDCGEGTQRQLRIAKINPNKITRLVITHLHGDHILGIPGLLATLGMSEYQKTLKIYGPRRTKRHLDLLEQTYGKFNIKYEVHEPDSLVVNEKDFMIEKYSMNHGIETHAYAFVEKEKRKLLKDKLKKLKLPNSPIIKNLQDGKDIVWKGKKIKAKTVSYVQPSRKVTIITDTKMNENAIKIARNSEVLICESTYSSNEKKYAEEHMHLTTSDAATIAKKAHAKKLLLVHTSQRYEGQEKTLEKEARKIFKNVRIVKDFDKLIV
jgi:ribonuclease Z